MVWPNSRTGPVTCRAHNPKITNITTLLFYLLQGMCQADDSEVPTAEILVTWRIVIKDYNSSTKFPPKKAE